MNKFEKFCTRKSKKQVFHRRGQSWGQSKVSSALWEMHYKLRKQAQPIIDKIRAAQDILDDLGGRPATGISGSPATGYYVVSIGGDNGDGMESNEPMWETGQALAQRDAMAKE